jgi:hypothetical protein
MFGRKAKPDLTTTVIETFTHVVSRITPCAHCKRLSWREDLHEVEVAYLSNNVYQSQQAIKHYFCADHAPKYDKMVAGAGHREKFYKRTSDGYYETYADGVPYGFVPEAKYHDAVVKGMGHEGDALRLMDQREEHLARIDQLERMLKARGISVPRSKRPQ